MEVDQGGSDFVKNHAILLEYYADQSKFQNTIWISVGFVTRMARTVATTQDLNSLLEKDTRTQILFFMLQQLLMGTVEKAQRL